MSDCYWMSGGMCYFEHLLENDLEGLIYDIIREVPKAREDMLDPNACGGCEFPERFIEEAKDPSPPKHPTEQHESFQNREWDRTSPPSSQRTAAGGGSRSLMISNEDLRKRDQKRKDVKGDD